MMQINGNAMPAWQNCVNQWSFRILHQNRMLKCQLNAQPVPKLAMVITKLTVRARCRVPLLVWLERCFIIAFKLDDNDLWIAFDIIKYFYALYILDNRWFTILPSHTGTLPNNIMSKYMLVPTICCCCCFFFFLFFWVFVFFLYCF